MTNPLVQDLADAAGHFLAHELNGFPESTRVAIGNAQARGGEIELRIRVGDPAAISIYVVSGEQAVWIATHRGEA
ncbi:MAG: hypothetical protein JWP29_1218 [Rhodoferax sp.]|nr:hypothetical protein [Rhodoferax sp.]